MIIYHCLKTACNWLLIPGQRLPPTPTGSARGRPSVGEEPQLTAEFARTGIEMHTSGIEFHKSGIEMHNVMIEALRLKSKKLKLEIELLQK